MKADLATAPSGFFCMQKRPEEKRDGTAMIRSMIVFWCEDAHRIPGNEPTDRPILQKTKSIGLRDDRGPD